MHQHSIFINSPKDSSAYPFKILEGKYRLWKTYRLQSLLVLGSLLSFLSPCVLPLVPVYVASLAGSDVFVTGAYNRRIPVFFHSLSFVIGFTTVFVIMGVGAGLAGFAMTSHLAVIRQIAGSFLIFFWLFMLASLKIPWLNYEKRLSLSWGTTSSYLRSFLIGAVFSLAWRHGRHVLALYLEVF
jgi:cytochrome c-type biogenesis protein